MRGGRYGSCLQVRHPASRPAPRVQLCAGLARRACGWEDEAMGRLDDIDLSLKLSRKEQDRLLALHGSRRAQLRLTLAGLIGSGQLGPPLCVLFEGWDASGKGGAIKRL